MLFCRALPLLLLAFIFAPQIAAAETSAPAVGNKNASANGQRGVLIFSDGNRLTGVLQQERGQAGRFVSDRFGDIAFSADEARFEPERVDDATVAFRGKTSANPVAPAPARAPAPAAPLILAAGAKPPPKPSPAPSALHPWKFKLNGFLDRTDDNGIHRSEYVTGLRIDRNTTSNQFFLDNRYEYAERNEILDRRRATSRGDWRHVLSPRWFTLYTPYLEYDGKTVATGRNDYLLNQQQGGIGYRLLTGPDYTSRVAATWSFFDLTNYDLGTESSFSAPSLILENNLRLPWAFELRQKGQVYYLAAEQTFGWDNEADLIKRLNKTLSLTLRHQYRRDYPALGLNPINRLRLLFGVEF